jgi:2,6-dihydroxypseudooxynicotine hydrolase
VALSGPYNMGANWDSLPELTREALRVRSHARTPEEGRANASTLSLEDVAERITCPIYIVAGRQDRVIPWQDAERLAREVKGPVVFSLIEDGSHVANNRGYKWRLQTADWMAEQLGA